MGSVKRRTHFLYKNRSRLKPLSFCSVPQQHRDSFKVLFQLHIQPTVFENHSISFRAQNVAYHVILHGETDAFRYFSAEGVDNGKSRVFLKEIPHDSQAGCGIGIGLSHACVEMRRAGSDDCR